MNKNNIAERRYIITNEVDSACIIMDYNYNCEQWAVDVRLNVVSNLVSNCNNESLDELNNDLYSYSTDGVLYKDRYKVRDIHVLYKALSYIFTDYFEYLSSAFDECTGIHFHVHNGKVDVLKKHIQDTLENLPLLHDKSIDMTISQTLKIGGKN